MSYGFADSLRAGSGRKLVHLVGFIIWIYHDARLPERQTRGNIELDLKEVGGEGTDWINLVQDLDSW